MSATPSINEILQHKQPLLLFDGDCALCDRLIGFFLAREKEEKMYFASLDSELAKEVMRYFDLRPGKDTMVLIRDHNAYIKSCAALRLSWYMRFPWPLLSGFLIIPPFLRNVVYDLVARKRLHWFGTAESCLNRNNFRQDRFLS